MARAALRSRDEMTRIISDEVRSGLTVGLKRATDSMSAHMVNEFSQHVSGSLRPELHLTQNNWTDSLLQTLQAQLLPGLLSAIGGQAGGAASGLLTTAMSSMAAARLIPNPILRSWLPSCPVCSARFSVALARGKSWSRPRTLFAHRYCQMWARPAPRNQQLPARAQEEIVRAVSDAFDQQIKAQKTFWKKSISKPRAAISRRGSGYWKKPLPRCVRWLMRICRPLSSNAASTTASSCLYI